MTLLERVYNYSIDIIEGKILASKKHKAACQRFIDNLYDTQNKEDYPYYFDVTELEDFYEWSREFRHTKGVLANQRIELTDFQLFVCANIFCWKKHSNDARRFRKVYIQLARKNAKSQLLALIASYVAFIGDEKEEVYVAGTTREQSKVVYDEIVSQLEKVRFLKGKYKTSYGKITHLKSGSTIVPLSKEAKKSGEGTNPSLAIIDEFHLHPTKEIYDALHRGMVARKSPLTVIITTAGTDLTSPCKTEYDYVSEIMDPDNVVENEEYFVMICEMEPEDDIKDSKLWIKANPILVTYQEGIDSLKGDLTQALAVSTEMTTFLTKNMNIWVNHQPKGYLNLEKWNARGIKKLGTPLPDITGKEVYIGWDLSSSIDLTSLAYLIPIGNETFVVLGHSFMPENTIQERINTDKVPYDAYIKQKWLTATPGDVVDFGFVKQRILKDVEKYGWKPKGIFYDMHNASQLSAEMQHEGYLTVKIPQRILTLSPSAKYFRDLVYKGLIVHDDNPLINRAIANVVLKFDAQENFMFDKPRSTVRIDPLAAIITANAQAQYHYQQKIDYGKYLTDDAFDKLGW